MDAGAKRHPMSRPKGARNRLSTRFLEALAADFNKFGTQSYLVGVTEITDEGGLTNGAKAQDTAGPAP